MDYATSYMLESTLDARVLVQWIYLDEHVSLSVEVDTSHTYRNLLKRVLIANQSRRIPPQIIRLEIARFKKCSELRYVLNDQAQTSCLPTCARYACLKSRNAYGSH